jgi:hypothetical protein
MGSKVEQDGGLGLEKPGDELTGGGGWMTGGTTGMVTASDSSVGDSEPGEEGASKLLAGKKLLMMNIQQTLLKVVLLAQLIVWIDASAPLLY